MSAEFKVRVSSDTTGAVAGISKVNKSLESLKSSASNVGSAIKSAMLPLAAVGGLATAGLIAGMKGLIDYGSHLQDLSDVTDISVESLVTLGEAFERAGLGAEDIEGILVKMSKALEDPSTGVTDWLDKLNISFGELEGLDMEQKFKRIGTAIASLDSQQQKIAATTAIFGKSSVGLVRMFKDINVFKDAEKYAGGLASKMKELAPVLEPLGDAIGGLKTKFREFFAELAINHKDDIQKITAWLNDLDFSKLARTIDDIFSRIKASIKSDGLWNTLTTKLIGILRDSGVVQAAKDIFKDIVPEFISNGPGGVVLDTLKNAAGPNTSLVATAALLSKNKYLGMGAAYMGATNLVSSGDKKMETVGVVVGILSILPLLSKAVKLFAPIINEAITLFGIVRSFGLIGGVGTLTTTFKVMVSSVTAAFTSMSLATVGWIAAIAAAGVGVYYAVSNTLGKWLAEAVISDAEDLKSTFTEEEWNKRQTKLNQRFPERNGGEPLTDEEIRINKNLSSNGTKMAMAQYGGPDDASNTMAKYQQGFKMYDGPLNEYKGKMFKVSQIFDVFGEKVDMSGEQLTMSVERLHRELDGTTSKLEKLGEVTQSFSNLSVDFTNQLKGIGDTMQNRLDIRNQQWTQRYTTEEDPNAGTFISSLQGIVDFDKEISKKEKNAFKLNDYTPVLSSLARVGGASALTKNPLVSIQQKANEYLSKIVKNTSTAPVATFA